jgi:hypothetical protein
LVADVTGEVTERRPRTHTITSQALNDSGSHVPTTRDNLALKSLAVKRFEGSSPFASTKMVTARPICHPFVIASDSGMSQPLSFHLQLGNLGEWTAAVLTGSAVLLSARTISRDRRNHREAEALKVSTWIFQASGTTEKTNTNVLMSLNVRNDGERPIVNARLWLFSKDGARLEAFEVGQVIPHIPKAACRDPGPDEWRQGSQTNVSTNTLVVTFDDADGKHWLRDSEGGIQYQNGWRFRRWMRGS